MQIVYLSNRPTFLNATLEQVDLFMPFIDKVVVICPQEISNEFHAPRRLTLDFVFEGDIFEGSAYKPLKDHQSLNYFLRSKAIKQGLIEDRFIMSDDDARPIRPVSESFFLPKGKYANYFFYDLSEWHYHMTAFDKGQQNTYALLKYHGLSTLSYAAHMPQIIDKRIYREAFEVFNKYSIKNPICEWTSYFNYAVSHYGDKFSEPKVYKTLCWPKLPGNWPLYVIPDNFYFENHYPDLYSKNGIFYGLPESPNESDYDLVNIEKIKQLRLIECGRFIAPVQGNDPWRKKSLKQKILNRFVRYGNGLTRKLLLKDRNIAYKIFQQMKSNK